MGLRDAVDKAKQQGDEDRVGLDWRGVLERQREQLALALPKSMDPERFTRIVLTTVKANPSLLGCDPASMLAAVMLSAQLGLEPGPLGQAYLVPFYSDRAKASLVQFLIGYRGMIDLARRSREIVTIGAREVCENDRFEFEYGLEERLVHKPRLTDRGDPIAYYGVARFSNGGHHMLVMSLEDVERRRGRSKAGRSGPWVTDFDAMARKSVIRAMFPFLPVSIDAARAVAADEAVAPRELEANLADVMGAQPREDEAAPPALAAVSSVPADGNGKPEGGPMHVPGCGLDAGHDGECEPERTEL